MRAGKNCKKFKPELCRDLISIGLRQVLFSKITHQNNLTASASLQQSGEGPFSVVNNGWLIERDTRCLNRHRVSFYSTTLNKTTSLSRRGGNECEGRKAARGLNPNSAGTSFHAETTKISKTLMSFFKPNVDRHYRFYNPGILFRGEADRKMYECRRYGHIF